VTLIVPQAGPPLAPPAGYVAGQTFTPGFVAQWRAEGFAFVPVGPARLVPAAEHFPRDPGIAVAKALADLLLSFDVAWFFERHLAAPTLRHRRFRERALPIVFLDELPDPLPIPASLAEINRAGAEAYALRHADRVAAPTLGSIEQAEALCAERASAPPIQPRRATTTPAVTVCLPYFEAPEYFPLTLASLERQTSTDFTVIAVDDGSFSTAGREAFDRCAVLYAGRGWKFLRQPNASPGAARNHAARAASTEFVLFLDSDDIAMPAMVERFLRGALLTGDDCLVAPNYGFATDPEGPTTLLYDPPGHSLVASMGDDMHGGSCIFIKRFVLLALGGFTAVRGIGFEDYELHIRLNLDGFAWDVLPEYVYRYRMPQAGNVSKATQQYTNQAGVLRWYERRLRPAGLGQMPLAIASAYWRQEHAADRLRPLEAAASSRRARRSPQGKELKILLLVCNFPYGMVSGWHLRVQQMIRYFGSRHSVTLMTMMQREQFAPVRKQASEFLHAIRGVEGSDKCASDDPNLPARVRGHYTDTFRNALRALPTGEFHLAILDQVFMAEFRHEIDTTCILTEHNIESRLLRQAAERSFSAELPSSFRNALREAERLERYEARAWSDVPLRAVCSEVDRLQVEARSSGGRTIVVPNGADLESWIPGARFEAQTLLFPAHLRYLPNVDAVEFLLEEIWPKVIARKPRTRLILAGRDPAEAIESAVRRTANVTLVRNPDSMRRIASDASLAVVPLRLGSGTRTKILEAMAWGLPLVSTTLGAEGIECEDGEHLLLGDTAEAFAAAVIRLLSDQPLWAKLRANGRQLVKQHYDWNHVFDPLEDAILNLVG
jgi:glycosyltransferase involved in cell wall biosynthesis